MALFEARPGKAGLGNWPLARVSGIGENLAKQSLVRIRAIEVSAHPV